MKLIYLLSLLLLLLLLLQLLLLHYPASVLGVAQVFSLQAGWLVLVAQLQLLVLCGHYFEHICNAPRARQMLAHELLDHLLSHATA